MRVAVETWSVLMLVPITDENKANLLMFNLLLTFIIDGSEANMLMAVPITDEIKATFMLMSLSLTLIIDKSKTNPYSTEVNPTVCQGLRVSQTNISFKICQREVSKSVFANNR